VYVLKKSIQLDWIKCVFVLVLALLCLPFVVVVVVVVVIPFYIFLKPLLFTVVGSKIKNRMERNKLFLLYSTGSLSDCCNSSPTPSLEFLSISIWWWWWWWWWSFMISITIICGCGGVCSLWWNTVGSKGCVEANCSAGEWEGVLFGGSSQLYTVSPVLRKMGTTNSLSLSDSSIARIDRNYSARCVTTPGGWHCHLYPSLWVHTTALWRWCWCWCYCFFAVAIYVGCSCWCRGLRRAWNGWTYGALGWCSEQ